MKTIDYETRFSRLPIIGTPSFLAGFDAKGKPIEIDPASLEVGGGAGIAFFEAIETVTTSTTLTTDKQAYLILINNSAPITLELPDFTTYGDRITLAKISNNSHAVTITTPGSKKIIGEDTYVLETRGESIVCVYAYSNNYILI